MPSGDIRPPLGVKIHLPEEYDNGSDLARGFKEAKDNFPDITFKLQHGDIHAHRAIIFGRAPKSFIKKWIPKQHRKSSGGTSLSESTDKNIIIQLQLGVSEVKAFLAVLRFLYSGRNDLHGDQDEFNKILTVKGKAAGALETSLEADLLQLRTSGLYADVTIRLPSAEGHDTLFKAHRFLLCIRSEYFRALLTSSYGDSQSSTLTLPAEPFTSKTVDCILRFIYSGSPWHVCDEDDIPTLIKIAEGADFLGMSFLYEFALTQIAQKSHKFACICSNCKKYYIQILKFAEKRKIQWLLDAAIWPLTEAFADTWDANVARLDKQLRDRIIEDIMARLDRNEVISVLKDWQYATAKFGAANGEWAEILRGMLDEVETAFRRIFSQRPIDVLKSPEFAKLIDGIGFSQDLLELSLGILVETLSERCTPMIYQVLIGDYLLREEGVGPQVAALINQSKDSILAYLRKRWVTAKGYNAFADLDTWAAKEIADELDLKLGDLVWVNGTHGQKKGKEPATDSASSASSTIATGSSGSATVASVRQTEQPRLDEERPRSLRSSVLNRNAAKTLSLGRPTKTSLLRAQSNNGSGSASSSSAASSPSEGLSRSTSAVSAPVRAVRTMSKVNGSTATGKPSTTSTSGTVNRTNGNTAVPASNTTTAGPPRLAARSNSTSTITKKTSTSTASRTVSRPASAGASASFSASSAARTTNKSNGKAVQAVNGTTASNSRPVKRPTSSDSTVSSNRSVKTNGSSERPASKDGPGSKPNAVLKKDDNLPTLQLTANPPDVLFWYKDGARIQVARGKLRFIGKVHSSPGLQAGIELPPGNEHANVIGGFMDGQKYFQVENKEHPSGRFVPAHHVTLERIGQSAQEARLEEIRAARLRRFDNRMRACPSYTWRPLVDTT